MDRREFLKGFGTLSAAAGVSWVGLAQIQKDEAEAHHRPGHDRGPGWRDREPEEPPEEPDPPDEEEPDPPEEEEPPPEEPEPQGEFPGDWGRTLVISAASVKVGETV